jgi:ribosomal protein S18 acetylase RimI-like enzyme
VHRVVQYRHFRNTDPPGLVALWNECFTGRGVVRLRHSTPLEYHVFAKPYFDPAGLILAEDEGVPVGFVHAGFGPNEAGTSVSTAAGVICVLGVRPAYRRRGIGSDLLRRAESYLRGRGAAALYAGQIYPFTPFYFGLYGGSDMPGFLTSDAQADPFFTHRGYAVYQTSQVLQRRLDRPLSLADTRFTACRTRFEFRMEQRRSVGTWWHEASQGFVEPFDFRLEEKPASQFVAHASVWEMEGFSWRWNQPAIGLTEIEVRPDLRRQGVAKYLLAQILRYLQDQFFGIVEVQILEPNEVAMRLCLSLGFETVDIGRAYQRSDSLPTA